MPAAVSHWTLSKRCSCAKAAAAKNIAETGTHGAGLLGVKPVFQFVVHCLTGLGRQVATMQHPHHFWLRYIFLHPSIQ